MSLEVKTLADIQERELVTFTLGDQEFGVNIMDVQEIVRMPAITQIPRSPFYVSGIANLRGNVLPVINTRQRFSMEAAEDTDRTRVVVVDMSGKNIGIIVDAVSQVMRVDESKIEPPPAITAGGLDGAFLNGVVKLDNGSRLVMALNPSEVCAISIEQQEEAASGSQSSSTQSKEDTRLQKVVEEEQLVTFALMEEEYGVDIQSVREIIRVPDVIHVPNAPEYMEGLISLRDKLVPLINLRRLFGEMTFEEQHADDEEDASDEQRVVVTDVNGMAIGLIVDKVNAVMRIATDLVDDPPAINAGSGSQVKGIAKLDDGKRLIMILDNNNLVDVESLTELDGVSADQGDSASESESSLSVEDESLEEEQLVTFRLGNEEFGIRIMEIQEINRLEEITKVPRTPSFVSGVTNLRGTVVPVIDLRSRFGMEPQEPDDRTRVVIIDLEGKRTGLIVDQVHEVLRILKADIEPTPAVVSSDAANDFIDGVGKMDDGKRMLVLLNVAKILSNEEQEELSQMGGGTKASAKQAAPAPASQSKKQATPAKKKRKSLKKAEEG